MITFSCTFGQKLSVKDEFIGKAVSCPHCKQRVTVPAAAVVPATAVQKNAGAPSGSPAPPTVSADTHAPAFSQLATATAGAPAAPVNLQPAFDFLAPPEAPGEIGRLGGYRILKLLGQGGMGMVFKAEDVNLSRSIALKVMRPEQAKIASAQQRFLREAKATAALKHDHIVTIYQVGEDRGVPFLAMEFLQGELLDSWLKKNPPTLSQALKLGREIASGLAAAHAKGLIHRDIKPANIWLEAPKGRVKILDFGLARSSGKEESKLTQAGAILGTPAYMSPEQARADKVDARSDLFSMGCILYELCTGQRPFQAGSIAALLMMVATADPKPPQEVNPEVPPAVADLILKLLAKKPDERFASAKEVVEAIQALEKGVRSQESEVKGQESGVRGQESGVRGQESGVKGEVSRDAKSSERSAEAAKPTKKTTDSFAEQATRAGGPPVPQAGAGRAGSVSDRSRRAGSVSDRSAAASPKRRLLRPALLGALVLGAVALLGWAVMRLTSDAGTLVIETDDPDIEIMVKQAGKSVTIIDPKTRQQIELKSGTYELALVDDTKGLRLSTKQFTLKRGEKEVVKVSLESAAVKKTEAKPKSEPQVKNRIEPEPEPKKQLEPPLEPKLPPVTKTPTISGQELLTLMVLDQVLSVCFSPDGKRLASASGDSTVKIWDAVSGQELLKKHTGVVISICFSPDGQRLAASGDTAKILNAASGQELLTLKGHNALYSICFSPDGKWLASAKDKTVKVWDASSGQELLTFMEHNRQSGNVRSVCFSPDGKRLTSAGSDTVKIWDASSGQELLTLREHTADIRSVCFSPDGKRLASGNGDDTVKIWDVTNGQDLLTLKGHTGRVCSVCFSPDGKRLASGSGDDTVKIWDVTSGQDLLTLKGHTNVVQSVCYSPDGKRLASGSADKTVKI